MDGDGDGDVEMQMKMSLSRRQPYARKVRESVFVARGAESRLRGMAMEWMDEPIIVRRPRRARA